MKGTKQKGITLIALIITIIIMLILVGVTISIVINSGLIGVAKNAGEVTSSAYNDEAHYGEAMNINGKSYSSPQDYALNNEVTKYIYKDGTEYEELSQFLNGDICTKQSDALYMSFNDTRTNFHYKDYFTTSNKVDITNINKISVHFSNATMTGDVSEVLFISKNRQEQKNDIIDFVQKNISGESITLELDVSDYEGEYYIGFGIASHSATEEFPYGAGGNHNTYLGTGEAYIDYVSYIESSGYSTKNLENCYRYIKMEITKLRDNPNGNAIQMSELVFYKENGIQFTYPSTTTITSNLNGASNNEAITKLIDNNVDTKYCSNLWGSSQTGNCTIIIDLGEGRYLDIDKYSSYSYYTANDANTRDPISWNLSVSKDGLSYELIDIKADATDDITTTRKARCNLWSYNNLD